jgi:hypothetical protein
MPFSKRQRAPATVRKLYAEAERKRPGRPLAWWCSITVIVQRAADGSLFETLAPVIRCRGRRYLRELTMDQTELLLAALEKHLLEVRSTVQDIRQMTAKLTRRKHC